MKNNTRKTFELVMTIIGWLCIAFAMYALIRFMVNTIGLW